MKKIILLLLVSIYLFCNSQEQFDEASVMAFQQKTNKHIVNKEKSLLKKEDLKIFTILNFFPINSKYAIVAQLVLSKKEKPFKMPIITN